MGWKDAPLAPSANAGWQDAPVVGSVPQQTESGGPSALRGAEFFSRGFMDSAANTLGAIPELAASGLRAIDPRLAPQEGFYPEYIRSGIRSFGETISSPINDAVDFGPADPQSTFERGAYGAGRGTADAASFMLPGAVVAKTAQAGTLPAKVGAAIASQPVAQSAAGAVAGGVSEATGSELAGLAAGLVTPMAPAAIRAAAKKIVSPFPSQLSPNEKNLAKAAEDIGIKLTPGQKTGSPGLQTMESSFGQLPLTSKNQREIYEAQRKAFNRAVMSRAGINADDASPEVIDDAFRSIGREFDDLASKTTVKIDQQFMDDIDRVANEYGRRLPTDVSPVFKSYMDDLNALRKEIANKPEIAGREYQKISSALKKRARSSGNNPDLQDALLTLSRTLDDTLERFSGPEIKSAWRDARNRYRNLLTIDKAVGGGTQADRASANIPLSGLRTSVKGMDKSGYGRGRGDLNNLSRVGDFLGAAIPPDTGTARRNYMLSLMTLGAGGGGGYAAAGGDPMIAALTAAGAIAGPKAVQLISQTAPVQSYLKNQAMAGPSSPIMSKALLGKILAAQELGNSTDQTMQSALGAR